jgi:hypothetical protein
MDGWMDGWISPGRRRGYTKGIYRKEKKGMGAIQEGLLIQTNNQHTWCSFFEKGVQPLLSDS